jgi:alpha-tubulin suppressor-like RCC1 family protein
MLPQQVAGSVALSPTCLAVIDSVGRLYGMGIDEGAGAPPEGLWHTSNYWPRPAINVPTINARITYVALGAAHVVAITAGGKALAWGSNESGQLGLAYESHWVSKPTEVPMGVQVDLISAAAGKSHTALLCGNGKVYTAGSNSCAQLGRPLYGKPTDSVYGVVESVAGLTMVVIAAVSNSTLMVSKDGHIYYASISMQATGVPDPQGSYAPAFSPFPLYPPAGYVYPAVSIAVGPHNAAFSDTRGNMFIVGYNDCGQLGNGTNFASAEPQLVTMLGDRCITTVALGDEFAAAVDSDGHVFTCGRGSGGALGHGDTLNQHYFKRVEYFGDNGYRVAAIVASGDMMAATTLGGMVFAWGTSSNGSLGQPTSGTPSVPSCTLVPVRILAMELESVDYGYPRDMRNGWGIATDAKDLRSGSCASMYPFGVPFESSWRHFPKYTFTSHDDIALFLNAEDDGVEDDDGGWPVGQDLGHMEVVD